LPQSDEDFIPSLYPDHSISDVPDDPESPDLEAIVNSRICDRISEAHEDIESPWIRNLPTTLRDIFDKEILRVKLGLLSPPPIRNFPLRDLVVYLHSKEGALIRHFG
jgi:hypothetical protein